MVTRNEKYYYKMATCTLLIVILSFLAVDAVLEMASQCGDTTCLNSGNCRVTHTRIGRDIIVGNQCICAGGWTGKSCEIGFEINIDTVNAKDAVVRVDSLVKNSATTFSSDRAEIQSDSLTTNHVYRLQYWPIDRDERVSCGIIPELTSSKYSLTGLHPGKHYVVCASSVEQDLCFGDVLRDFRNKRNCAIVKTVQTSTETTKEFETINLASVIVPLTFVSIIFIILCLVIVVRKRRVRFQNSYQNSCLDLCCHNLPNLRNHRICGSTPPKRVRWNLNPRNIERDTFIGENISGRLSRHGFKPMVCETDDAVTTASSSSSSVSVSVHQKPLIETQNDCELATIRQSIHRPIRYTSHLDEFRESDSSSDTLLPERTGLC